MRSWRPPNGSATATLFCRLRLPSSRWSSVILLVAEQFLNCLVTGHSVSRVFRDFFPSHVHDSIPTRRAFGQWGLPNTRFFGAEDRANGLARVVRYQFAPNSTERRVAAATALIKPARTPARSSAWMPAMVV